MGARCRAAGCGGRGNGPSKAAHARRSSANGKLLQRRTARGWVAIRAANASRANSLTKIEEIRRGRRKAGWVMWRSAYSDHAGLLGWNQYAETIIRMRVLTAYLEEWRADGS